MIISTFGHVTYNHVKFMKTYLAKSYEHIIMSYLVPRSNFTNIPKVNYTKNAKPYLHLILLISLTFSF